MEKGEGALGIKGVLSEGCAASKLEVMVGAWRRGKKCLFLSGRAIGTRRA